MTPACQALTLTTHNQRSNLLSFHLNQTTKLYFKPPPNEWDLSVMESYTTIQGQLLANQEQLVQSTRIKLDLFSTTKSLKSRGQCFLLWCESVLQCIVIGLWLIRTRGKRKSFIRTCNMRWESCQHQNKISHDMTHTQILACDWLSQPD